MKSEKKKECNHMFKYVEKSIFHVACCGETVERKVKCIECGLEAKEVWVYSGTFTESGEEV